MTSHGSWQSWPCLRSLALLLVQVLDLHSSILPKDATAENDSMFSSRFSTPTPGRYTLGDQDHILSWTLNNHSSDWTFLMNTANTFKRRKTIENIYDISMSSRNVTKKTAYPCLSTATLSNRTLSFWSIAAVCHQPGIRQRSSNHLKKSQWSLHVVSHVWIMDI